MYVHIVMIVSHVFMFGLNIYTRYNVHVHVQVAQYISYKMMHKYG